MKISPITNITFSGYKNVVTHALNEPRFDLMYIGMQLDNEGGYRDLDTYNELKRLITDKTPFNDDILTITYLRYGDMPHKFLYNEYELSSDKNLNYLRTKLPPESFKEYEKSTMRIYTHLASLTRRLRADFIPETDSQGIALVLARFLNTTMSFMSYKEDDVLRFINNTLRSKTPPQLVADTLNRKIKKMMKNYLL